MAEWLSRKGFRDCGRCHLVQSGEFFVSPENVVRLISAILALNNPNLRVATLVNGEVKSLTIEAKPGREHVLAGTGAARLSAANRMQDFMMIAGHLLRDQMTVINQGNVRITGFELFSASEMEEPGTEMLLSQASLEMQPTA